MSTLQEQIESRMKEAWEKRIGEKAEKVARMLGADQKPHRGTWLVFEDSRLRIDFLKDRERSDEDYASSGTMIVFDGQAVYDWSDDTRLDEHAKYAGIVGLTCYIPGEWEKQLDALAQLADGTKASAEKLAETAKTVQAALDEQAERRKWGL